MDSSNITFIFYLKSKKKTEKIVLSNQPNDSKLSNVLSLAISEYNKKTNGRKIVDEVTYYRVYEVNDQDEPEVSNHALQIDKKISTLNSAKFSVVIEKEHMIKSDLDNSMASGSVYTNNDNKKTEKKVIKNYEIETKQDDGGFCCCLKALFGCNK